MLSKLVERAPWTVRFLHSDSKGSRSLLSVLLTAASLTGKVGVLVTIAAISRAYHGPQRDVLVFAITSSVACTALLDPQTTPLLLLRYSQRGAVSTGVWLDCHVLEVLGALLGVCLSVVAVVATCGIRDTAGLAAPLAVLLSAAALEQLWRFRRVGWQVSGRYGRYAAIDASIGIGRLASALCLVLISPWAGWTLLAAASCAHGLWLLRPPLIEGRRPGTRVTFRAALPYGLSTTLASVYSQMPSVIAGIAAGPATGVVLGVASRLAQPTELAAQSISSLGLQRLAANPQTSAAEYRWMLRSALLAAILCGGIVAVVGSFAGHLLGATGDAVTAVMIISGITLVPKFIDYQQVSRLISGGNVMQRLRASATTAAVVFVAITVAAIANRGDHARAAIAVSSLILAGELLLLVTLRRAIKQTL